MKALRTYDRHFKVPVGRIVRGGSHRGHPRPLMDEVVISYYASEQLLVNVAFRFVRISSGSK